MKPTTLAAIAALTVACSSEGIEYETETYGEAEFARTVVYGYGYQGDWQASWPPVEYDYCKLSDKCWRPESKSLEFAVFDNPDHHPWFNRLLLDALNDAVRPARDRGWNISITSSSDNSEDGFLDRFDDVHGFVVSHEFIPYNDRCDVWMRDFPSDGDGNYYGHVGRIKINDARIWDEANGDPQSYSTAVYNYLRRMVGHTLGIGWSDGEFAGNSPVMGGEPGHLGHAPGGPNEGWYDSVKAFSSTDMFYIENYIP